MLFPDLSFTLSQRRRVCVLEPGLMLSRFGVALVRRLGDAMELWIPREFWHILDNSQFFRHEPEALFHVSEGRGVTLDRRARRRDEIATAMREWERIRTESDLSGLKVFWVGDGLSESLIPPSTATDLVGRYESLAHDLDRDLAECGPMASAARDTAALAAALGPALVLTSQSMEDRAAGAAPALCALLRQRVLCHSLGEGDPLAATEREHMRHLLVHAGAASLLWSGLNLIIVHFAVPAAALVEGAPPSAATDDLSAMETGPPAAEPRADLWEDARAFWYRL